jgi:hypothetical protein
MGDFWKKFVDPKPEGFHVHRTLDFVRNCALSAGITYGGWTIKSEIFPVFVIGWIAIVVGVLLQIANLIWMASLVGYSWDQEDRPQALSKKLLLFAGVLFVCISITALLFAALSMFRLNLR